MQYLVINHNEKESQKNIYKHIYVCITESHCCKPKTTQDCKSTILQEKKKKEEEPPGELRYLDTRSEGMP